MQLEIINKPQQYSAVLLLTSDIQSIKEQKIVPTSFYAYIEKYISEGKNTCLLLPSEEQLCVVALVLEEKKDGAALVESYRRLASKAFGLLTKEKVADLAIVGDVEAHYLCSFIEGFYLSSYRFEKYKSTSTKEVIARVGVQEGLYESLVPIVHVCEANFVARTLVNEPVCYLTAPQLSQEIQVLSQTHGFTVDILEKQQIEDLKMGGLLAVNKGSEVPPTFNILEWKAEDAKNSQPVVLVGKGVVYDTGGYDLKTGGHMSHMKMDMGGAAAVVGTVCALAKNEVPIHVIGLIPATDNRIGPNGLVSDDVINMYDGTTVEVKNTDAEGRLILADALAYAKKYTPALVIDLATLTGAAMRVTSHYGTAMMGNASKETKAELMSAGENVHERLIEFPFWEEFEDEIKSDVADIKNLGNPAGGASTAGKFLEHFTDYPWIHLDIAGPAFVEKPYHYLTTGGTGVGVRLLYDFLSKGNF